MNNNIYIKGLVVVLIIALTIMASLWVRIASKNRDIKLTDALYREKDGIMEEKEQENDNSEPVNQSYDDSEDKKGVIDIDGAVKNPGVYEFNDGDRVSDAILKAGGLTETAYTKSINRARLLVDGEKIYILEEGEEISDKQTEEIFANEWNPTSSEKVNINTASKEILMSLNGIGEVYAQRIIEYRSKSKFVSIDDIKNIEGIGEKTFQDIKEDITIE